MLFGTEEKDLSRLTSVENSPWVLASAGSATGRAAAVATMAERTTVMMEVNCILKVGVEMIKMWLMFEEDVELVSKSLSRDMVVRVYWIGLFV